VVAAAYRAGIEIVNDYDCITHDYSQKGGVVHSRVMIPANAPPEFADRAVLWNAVENTDKNRNARLAREIEFALPAELTRAEQIKLVDNYVQNNFVSWGMCADVNIHDKRDGNPHAHIMLTMRPINDLGEWEQKSEKVYLCKNKEGEERGFTAKELAETGNEWEKQLPYYEDGNAKKKPLYLTKSEAEREEYKNYARAKGKKDPKYIHHDRENETYKLWNSVETLEYWREEWAKSCNEVFDRLNISENIDHRSYERQGVDKEPTVHLGAAATQMKLQGKASERATINEEIRAENREAEEQKEALRNIDAEIDKLKRKLVARTYGIIRDVERDKSARFNETVSDKLSEEWAQCVKADMELQGYYSASERASEYGRKAAVLSDMRSEYAKIGKEVKSLRERFAKTGILGAGEREQLTKRINELAKRRKEISTSAKKTTTYHPT
jgi:ATP-dependent exoDNAse (exonuclease V) alpha subunit